MKNQKRKRGRPRAKENTIRILNNGLARLSPDLAKAGDYFILRFNKTKVTLSKCCELSAMIQYSSGGWPLVKAYKSNPKAKSTIISFYKILNVMGLPFELVAGFYKTKIVDGLIEIDLEREMELAA